MKISDMTNDQAAEALIRLAVPFERICDDEELLEALDKLKAMGSQPVIKVVAYLVPTFVSIGLKRHRDDLYEIVGALTQESTAKVGRMNFKQTIKVLQDSYDDILKDFFTPTAIVKRTVGTK